MYVGKTSITTYISPPQKATYCLHTKYSPLKPVLLIPPLKFKPVFPDFTKVSAQICEKALRKKITQGKVQL